MATTITPTTILALLCALPLQLLAMEDGDPRRALVHIRTVAAAHDFHNPWTRLSPRRGSGSGALVEGGLILTNAHVVSDATWIEVRLHGSPRPLRAQIEAIVHDADLAFLRVEESEAFAHVTPLEFGPLPRTLSEVTVYGFPVGGDGLSITRGVLSRIGMQNYAHSGLRLLAGQIDAAVNPGNSGGPVLHDGKVVGVVMQGRPDADGIGYLAPAPVIAHVIEDLEDGSYDGFPSLGIGTQGLTNPALKARYGVAQNRDGVVVTRIVDDSPSSGILLEDDVILSIDGHEVAANGTVALDDEVRVGADHIVNTHQVGEDLVLTIFRQGEELELSIPLTATIHQRSLVPLKSFEEEPRYFVYGGLVFTPLTRNYLERYGNQAPRHLLRYTRNHWQSDEQRRVVVLQRVLPAAVNQGYHGMTHRVITSVDGQPVRDLAHLIELIEAVEGPLVTLIDDNGNRIALNRALVDEESPRILSRYRIPGDRSSHYR